MWEIYAYQNADSLFGIFNATAAVLQLPVGAEANYLSKWVFDLSYTNFFGGGSFNLIHDRDFVQVAARYSFYGDDP